MVYPPWESLASVLPRPNFPAEDKSHNLHINIVDPIHHRPIYGWEQIYCGEKYSFRGTITLRGSNF